MKFAPAVFLALIRLPLGEGAEGLCGVTGSILGQETDPDWQPTFHPFGEGHGDGNFGEEEEEAAAAGGLEEEEAAAWLFGGDCEALGAER